MNSLISGALFVLLVLSAIRGAAETHDTPPALDPRAHDHDVNIYQRALEGQQRSLDALDAILSATGLLLFTAMTYLLAIESIRDGTLVPRIIAIALLIPIGVSVYGLLGFDGSDAPNLTAFDEALHINRNRAYIEARAAMVVAFERNRAIIASKRRFRTLGFALGALLFGIDLLGFVVRW